MAKGRLGRKIRPIRLSRPKSYPLAGVGPPLEIQGTHIEFDDEHGFDNGTTPYTPVYVRNIWDEQAEVWSTECSLNADYSTIYSPVGDIVLRDTRVQLGGQSLALSSVGKSLVVPAYANWAQIEFVGSNTTSVAQYSHDGSDPLTAPFHRLQDGGFVSLHSVSLPLFRAALEPGSSAGSLHIFYFYDPAPLGGAQA